ncbi:hypothetical protein EIN_365100 [Entamoeba invadens IP1]|uniref:RRM domain-containing protein n=1 Tax=Entamoeba invadens IP1 TaxID=370355 RepID=L7FMV8_ENTIV|nr:hypothetical protein EIN_365100 [Entamoeba invadens IP1]ELP91971.1 hypothetical protein EIN_365100 [Entamoeba invadens IP1]|eukprot:XP_004258742.1 hypothetical protein EIN_365100 [Entamoeba invadens IP1]
MDRRTKGNNEKISQKVVPKQTHNEEDTVGSKVPPSVMPKNSITKKGIFIPSQNQKKTILVCVSNLDQNVTKEQLKQLFMTVGKVLKISIPTNKKGKPKSCALIKLDSDEAVDRAVNSLNKTKLNDQKITVEKKMIDVMNVSDLSNKLGLTKSLTFLKPSEELDNLNAQLEKLKKRTARLSDMTANERRRNYKLERKAILKIKKAAVEEFKRQEKEAQSVATEVKAETVEEKNEQKIEQTD